jgi:hypothetical protein
MIDLNNEEHVRCLRETVALCMALTLEQRETWLEKLRRDCALSEYGPVEVLAAAEALTDPTKAAELIRQLVERAGAKWYLTTTKLGVAFYRDKPHRREEEEFWFACHELPFLIARLLDLPPNAGAEAVLKALRGET